MRKYVSLLLMCFLLTGCKAQETFETVSDDLVHVQTARMAEIYLELPEEAAAPVSQSEQGTLYQCDGYDLLLQTLEAGDLDRTLRAISGRSREELTVLETGMSGVKRYDLVWSCIGETGEQVCRACVLDDGNYHYVLTAQADADRAGELETVWEEIFGSYSVG